jgi:hypothetical protein
VWRAVPGYTTFKVLDGDQFMLKSPKAGARSFSKLAAGGIAQGVVVQGFGRVVADAPRVCGPPASSPETQSGQHGRGGVPLPGVQRASSPFLVRPQPARYW